MYIYIYKYVYIYINRFLLHGRCKKYMNPQVTIDPTAILDDLGPGKGNLQKFLMSFTFTRSFSDIGISWVFKSPFFSAYDVLWRFSHG